MFFGTANRRVVWPGALAALSLLVACRGANKGSPSSQVLAHLPMSTATEPLPSGAATVVLTPSALTMKGQPDVEIASVPADTSHGFAASLKSDGENGLNVVPLASALAAHSAFDTLTIMADPSLAYRILIEVIFTAQRAHSAPLRDCFGVRAAGKPAEDLHAICIDPKSPDAAAPVLNVTVSIVPEGFSLKAGARPVAPGCRGVGPGVTVPKNGSEYDFAGLTTCLASVKQLAPEALKEESSVLVSANPETPFQVLVSTMDAARTAPNGEKLYPDVSFAVNRPGMIPMQNPGLPRTDPARDAGK